MRSVRGWLATAAAIMVLGVFGCGEDNDKTSGITSVAPPPGAPPAAKSQSEYFKQSQSNLKAQGYPGAK